jgi:HK97 gp10 family phage protein
MKININVKGLENISSLVDDVIDKQDIKRAMGKACALVERKAKEKAPKDTGELRRSITSEVVDKGGSITGVIYTPLEYAPYVEFGTGLFAEGGNGRKDVPWHYQDDEGNWHSTSGQHPHPFMRPALNESRTQILRILKEGLGK